MQKTQEAMLLRRTGAILGLIGLSQVVLVALTAPAGTLHLEVFNFNIVFGIVLAAGSLRAASAIRWLACFGLLPTALFLLASLLLQPVSLLQAQLRFVPLEALADYGGRVLTLGVILFLMRQLGSAPVLAARAAAGRKVRDMRIPLAMGGVLALATVGLQARAIHSADAAYAIGLAQAELGPDYAYFTNNLSFQFRPKPGVVARVQAWNERELREIPVRWDTP
ncbi:MAG: hypothetical protein K0R43_2855 [Pseudoduganella sp.]|jgi:hypothetical protein|nr:hypothetical protein [Pseudoduganella sp.]